MKKFYIKINSNSCMLLKIKQNKDVLTKITTFCRNKSNIFYDAVLQNNDSIVSFDNTVFVHLRNKL